MKMPFGKYKGEEVCDIPLDYLKWAEENLQLWKDLREEINAYIQLKEGDVSSQGRWAGKIKLI